MKSLAVHTLGCKLNYSESSTIARDLQSRGYSIVPFGESADLTVINTCTVTEQAESTCRNAVRRALSANSEGFVVVTGCYAQLRPEALAAIPGVDLVLGAADKFRIPELVDSLAKRESTQIEVSCIDEDAAFGPAFSSGSRTRSFLKVQDGCDYSCSFCTIPAARGPSRSQSIERTLEEARRAAETGAREIVLTGVNIGLFGEKTNESLLQLIERLDSEIEIDRFRISSIEPNLLTEEIVDFVAQSKRFMPHFHIPLQSGDDRVLGKMRRRYRTDLYQRRIDHIRSVMPDSCIGADVIVGFPAETEEAFDKTHQFLAELPVSYLHVFTYSERPGTVAVETLEESGSTPIPKSERSRRSRLLRSLSVRKKRDFYQQFVGKTRPVLWEDANKEGFMFGYSDNYVRYTAPYDTSLASTVENIRIDRINEAGLAVRESQIALDVLAAD